MSQYYIVLESFATEKKLVVRTGLHRLEAEWLIGTLKLDLRVFASIGITLR